MQAHQSFYSKYAKYFRGWKVMEVEKRLASVDLTTSSEKFLIQTRMLRKWFAEYGLTTSSWHPPTSTVRRSLEQCTARAQTRSVISQRVIVKGSPHRNSPPHRAEQTNTSSRPLKSRRKHPAPLLTFTALRMTNDDGSHRATKPCCSIISLGSRIPPTTP